MIGEVSRSPERQEVHGIIIGFDSPETCIRGLIVSTGAMHSNTMQVQRVVPIKRKFPSG